MATYQILNDDGVCIDAHVDLDGDDIVFASRGGTRGASDTRNTAYGEGLRLVLERLSRGGFVIEGAWLDSGPVQHLPLADRSIFDEADRVQGPAEQFRILSTRMKAFGRTAPGPGGNSTKRIRVRVAGAPTGGLLKQVLGVTATQANFRSQERLSAELLGKITHEHVWNAIQRFLEGPVDHAFGASTDFDLVVEDGVRLPPKAVFGLAASEALGMTILPKHFTGGLGTPCFRILEAAGYRITPKGEALAVPEIPTSAEDREWSEGNPKLVLHLKKERGTGLSRAKKQAFIREHGRLFCERCDLDPIAVYGVDGGDACIEVHHRKVQVMEMAPSHRTRLEDLQCLCANCHRVVHALFKKAASVRA